MSYILDALKKADAQRERDPARGIHAQPVPASGAPRRSSDRYRGWFWGVGAVGLALAGALGWDAQRDQGAMLARTGSAIAVAPVPLVAPAAAVVPVAPQPVLVATAVMPPAPPPAPVLDEPGYEGRRRPLPAPRGRPQQVAAAPPASGAAAAFGAAPPGPAVAPSAGATAAPSTAIGPSAAALPASAPVRAPAVAVPPAPVNPPPPPPPPPRIPVIVPTPPVAGLPPDAPKLVITGGVYSTNPSQRMLIVNGQVVNQGADLGSGVTLEEIKPKAAVLGFRGGRYSIAY